MKRETKRVLKLIAAISFCFLMWGCNLKTPGTNTGNPDFSSPTIELSGIYKLAYLLCAKIDSCYPEASLNTCYAQVIALSGYTSELGPTGSTYSTINDLASAERSNAVTTNATNFDACEDALTQLTCSDPLIQNNYTPVTADQYAQTKFLFGVSNSCSQIY